MCNLKITAWVFWDESKRILENNEEPRTCPRLVKKGCKTSARQAHRKFVSGLRHVYDNSGANVENKFSTIPSLEKTGRI